MAEVIIDEKVRFGKPIIKGTRISVDEILGALAGGMTYEEIEREYGIKKDGALAALQYATEIISEEKVGVLKIKEWSFFLDANIPYSVLEIFTKSKLKAIYARDINLHKFTDDKIFEYVVKNEYILITKDLEFANPTIFPIKKLTGLIILCLPFFFNAG